MRQSLSTTDMSAPINTLIATGLMVSLCSIYQPPVDGSGYPVVDALGQVDLSNLTAVSGLQDIPCMLAVEAMMRPDITGEIRGMDQFDAVQERHCLLNGNYPSIVQKMVAIVDGTTYEIMAAEQDSQHTMTRLALRVYQL